MDTVLKGVATLLWLIMLGSLVIGVLSAFGCARSTETITIDPTTGIETRIIEASSFDTDKFLYVVDILMASYGAPLTQRYLDLREQELLLQAQRLEQMQEQQPENDKIEEALQHVQEFLALIETIKEGIEDGGE